MQNAARQEFMERLHRRLRLAGIVLLLIVLVVLARTLEAGDRPGSIASAPAFKNAPGRPLAKVIV